MAIAGVRWITITIKIKIRIRSECHPASGPGDPAPGVLEHDALQEADAFFQPFLHGHQAVLVLDGEGAVVSHHAQGRNEVAPEMPRVAVTHSAENPGAI